MSWQRPVNAFPAKHSIPFNVAVRLVKNSNGLEAFTQGIVEDTEIRNLMARIEVREDPAYTRVVPQQRPARVEIRLRDGAIVTGVCETPRGGYDKPFDDS